MKIVVIGAGNVGTHIVRQSLEIPEVEVVQWYNRSPMDSQELGAYKGEIISDLHTLKPADVYLIAVSDRALGELSEMLPIEKQLIAHTSGVTPMETLDNSSNRRGVWYPLQSFSKSAPVQWEDTPILTEAEHIQDQQTLQNLAQHYSPLTYRVNSEQRSALHVAAVMANNFTNHLLHLSKEYCKDKGLDFEILHPLIRTTFAKALKDGPYHAQTGPARRGDISSVEKHLTMLSDDLQKKIYSDISQSIFKTYPHE